jgi:flagellar biosynthesis anti-sigma factor FlgM
MRIAYVTQPFSAELRKTDSARKTEKEVKNTRVTPSDKSEISKGAQRLSATKAEFQTIAASIDAQSDIRTEKIAEVKQKIESGYYNSEEFIDKLADKLLAEFGLKE